MPMGDDGFGLDVPETQPVEGADQDIKDAASFTKTKDYKNLKEHMDSRIAYYQTYLPDGRPVQNAPDFDRIGPMWIAANVVIGEFKAVLGAYEQAAAIIAEENRKANSGV